MNISGRDRIDDAAVLCIRHHADDFEHRILDGVSVLKLLQPLQQI